MRSLLLSMCFIFALIASYSHISYSADFSYDIDRFTQVGGGVAFVDEFNDDAEPPRGPGGVGDYRVDHPFSPTAESGSLLNLNSNDAKKIDSGLSEIDATNVTVASFIKPSGGGSVEGIFRFTNGINVNTSFGIGIKTLNAFPYEEVYFGIGRMPSGKFVAYFDASSNDVDTDISISDISNSVLGGTGVTGATLRLEVSALNVVTASIDYGSDGIFELIVPGSYTMDFHPGENYTGNFYANSFSFLECDYMPNPDGSISIHISNEYGENLPVGWKLWAEFGATKIPIINLGSDGSFILPPGFDVTLPLFPPGLPSGLTIGSRFVDPIMGQEFCVDTLTIP